MSRITLANLIATLEIHEQRSLEAEALGWIVVTIDKEFSTLVHAQGLYPTPEAALIAAQSRYEQDKLLAIDGEIGWSHTVLPLLAP